MQIFPRRDPRNSSKTLCVLICPQNLNNLRRIWRVFIHTRYDYSYHIDSLWQSCRAGAVFLLLELELLLILTHISYSILILILILILIHSHTQKTTIVKFLILSKLPASFNMCYRPKILYFFSPYNNDNNYEVPVCRSTTLMIIIMSQ